MVCADLVFKNMRSVGNEKKERKKEGREGGREWRKEKKGKRKNSVVIFCYYKMSKTLRSFLWHQYFHHSQFQTTNMISLDKELGRDVYNWLVPPGSCIYKLFKQK